MKVGDKVKVIGLLNEHGILEGDLCTGAVGITSQRGILFPWIVTFDHPIEWIENKYWVDMPCYESELELLNV